VATPFVGLRAFIRPDPLQNLILELYFSTGVHSIQERLVFEGRKDASSLVPQVSVR
jgi:hypothetical protein